MGISRNEIVVGFDLRSDAHVHTGFSAGRDSVGAIVSAADRAGLGSITFADQVGPETAWLPAYADAIRRARRRTELSLRIAAEVEVVRADGWLAWPADISQLDAVSVAVPRLPLTTGPIGPREVRVALAGGVLAPAQVAEILVTATINGLERAGRYAPVQLARPLVLLAQAGVEEAAVTPELAAALADACRSTGALVEISEAWRSPSPAIVGTLRGADVKLVAASDARYAVDVGQWQYLRRV